MHHERIIEMVSDLVRAASIKGSIRLKIVYNAYVLQCHDACEQLQFAWDAISKSLEVSDTGADYLLQLYSMLQSRGSDCSLWVTQDGIATPIEKAKFCLSMWMAPHQLAQLDRFASAVGKSRSDAAELLITSGLQIRSLIRDVGV